MYERGQRPIDEHQPVLAPAPTAQRAIDELQTQNPLPLVQIARRGPGMCR
ncbi:hypothetical protein P9869_12165 [Streptomyces ossamyceticus]|nr:hypothetical protein [Streptomyces ossamyceticus]